MSNAVIDQQTQTHKFGVWPVTEKVQVTLTLVETGPDQFGINYDAVYSGVKHGQVSGGPIAVSGNGNWTVNNSPKVVVTVSNYNDNKSQQYISMQVTITVDIPVIGTKTIFDGTLEGAYQMNLVNAISEHLNQLGSGNRQVA